MSKTRKKVLEELLEGEDPKQPLSGQQLVYERDPSQPYLLDHRVRAPAPVDIGKGVEQFRTQDEHLNQVVRSLDTKIQDQKLFAPGGIPRTGDEIQDLLSSLVLNPQFKRMLLAKLYRDCPSLRFAMEHHRTTFGGNLTFENRKFLKELYYIDFRKERYRRLVLQKSVQCGVSEWLICTLFAFAELGISMLYVLPNRDFRARFVTNRIDRVIDMVPYYREMLNRSKVARGRDSTNLKHIGNATQYFASSGSENEFKEFPTDAVVVDEKDQCVPENIALAEDRFSASPWKISIKVSNPTHTSFGICVDYSESTQGRWMVKCTHCPTGRGWQELNWWTHFVLDQDDGTCVARERGYDPMEETREPVIFCVDCDKPLDPLGPGAWVHAYPRRDVVGFKISKLFQGPPMTTNREMMLKYFRVRNNSIELTKFVNSDLGEGFAPKGQQITREMLNDSRGDHRMGYNPDKVGLRTMGVDVGDLINYWISDHPRSGKRRLLDAGAVPSFQQIQEVMDLYKVDMCVVDNYPEVRQARKFQDRNPKVVVLCTYYDNGQELEYKDDEGTVTIDRTVAIDQLVAVLRNGDMVVPADAEGYMGGELYDQMMASVRVFMPDNRGSGKYRWQHVKPDHFMHAAVYDEIAYHIMTSPMGGSAGIFQLRRDSSVPQLGKTEAGKVAKEVTGQLRRAKTIRQREIQSFLKSLKSNRS